MKALLVVLCAVIAVLALTRDCDCPEPKAPNLAPVATDDELDRTAQTITDCLLGRGPCPGAS